MVFWWKLEIKYWCEMLIVLMMRVCGDMQMCLLFWQFLLLCMVRQPSWLCSTKSFGVRSVVRLWYLLLSDGPSNVDATDSSITNLAFMKHSKRQGGERMYFTLSPQDGHL